MSYDEPFEVFYDGDCPICLKEVNMLRKLDRNERITFTDIAPPTFDAVGHTGLTYETLMGSIHGRMSNGDMVEGVEVFRQLYGRVGLGGAVWLTRLPGIRHCLDAGYSIFARHRLRLTGRCLPAGACRVQYDTETADSRGATS